MTRVRSVDEDSSHYERLLWKGAKKVKGSALLSVPITTACNRRCPDCCFHLGGPGFTGQHHDWDYFSHLASYVRGKFDTIVVGGGEPTIHPEFERITREFKDLFGCRALRLATNGARVRDYLHLMSEYEVIKLTSFPGTRPVADALVAADVTTVHYRTDAHLPWVPRPGHARPCPRGALAIYWEGRLYKCCVSPGVEGAQSIELTSNWRDELQLLPLPCDRCPFALRGEYPYAR